jgi:hypothetical protein
MRFTNLRNFVNITIQHGPDRAGYRTLRRSACLALVLKCGVRELMTLRRA